MFKILMGLTRLFSILDGLSFLVLLYFSIYEKGILGNEAAVSIPGKIHGGIFTVLFLLVILLIALKDWPLKRAGQVMLCALIPLAPFFLEPSLKREQNAHSK